MDNAPRAFVAYTARDAQLAALIATGVAKANQQNRAIRYTPWEFNDIAGHPITSPILEGIEASLFIVADITYLNPNVVYETGFAIGSSKRAFLVRRRGVEGDERVAQAAGIFDTLGSRNTMMPTSLPTDSAATLIPRHFSYPECWID